MNTSMENDLMLTKILVDLETNAAFCELMEHLEKRLDYLGAWSCFEKDDVSVRWTQGRMQELSELMRAWKNRRTLRDEKRITMNGAAFS